MGLGRLDRHAELRLQHLSENQHLELHILHCKERLQQRLLKEQIAQLRLKAVHLESLIFGGVVMLGGDGWT